MKSKRYGKEARGDDFVTAAERASAASHANFAQRIASSRCLAEWKTRGDDEVRLRSMTAKTLNPLKVPFGTAKGVRLRNARNLQWEDAFEIDFEDGLSFLEPHATIRKANKISEKASVQRVELEDEFQHGFFVHYDNGQTAEVSWSFIRELPPKGNDKSLLDEMEETVISAIKNKHVLSFFYDDAIRTIEPLTYGISTAGHPVLRGYQIAGGGKSGHAIGLRLYELAKMEGLRDTKKRFSRARPQHKPNDSAMSKVIVSLPLPGLTRKREADTFRS